MPPSNARLSKIAVFLVLAFGLLVTCHADEKTSDVPSANAPLAQLFSSALRRLSIDPASVIRNHDGSFTVIVVDSYTDKARAMGLVPQDVAASSGRALINCSLGTYRVLTDHKVDSKWKIVGEVGDAGAGGEIDGNPIVSEIASLMCKAPLKAKPAPGTAII